MKKPIFAILKNESSQDYLSWVVSCEKQKDKIDFEVIDITKDDWLKKVKEKKYEVFLASPPATTSLFKQLYDERITILSRDLEKIIYPSIKEILLYENKKNLSYWLEAVELPMPPTKVFYIKEDAIRFIKNANYPVVAKLNIGASGSGVEFLNNESEASEYISKAFSHTGLSFKSGPKMNKGNLYKKLWKVISKKGFVSNRLREYKALSSENQKGFVLFQEFIKHDFEWRCVRIGDSFFAHKKVAKKGKASGTLMKSYDNPPMELFDYIKKISDEFALTSVAIDLFEHNGLYLINEIQCIFGQSDPYQMLVNDVPGRYVFKNNTWNFEEGTFNTNMSYDLRLEHAFKLIKLN